MDYEWMLLPQQRNPYFVWLGSCPHGYNFFFNTALCFFLLIPIPSNTDERVMPDFSAIGGDVGTEGDFGVV
jgi:hypothetical protein